VRWAVFLMCVVFWCELLCSGAAGDPVSNLQGLQTLTNALSMLPAAQQAEHSITHGRHVLVHAKSCISIMCALHLTKWAQWDSMLQWVEQAVLACIIYMLLACFAC
jgi:hypothetical protein